MTGSYSLHLTMKSLKLAISRRKRLRKALRALAARPPKTSLLTLTIPRRQRCDIVETFDCRYKFDVHDEDNEVFQFPNEELPPELVTDGGIVFLVIVQWDVLTPFMNGRLQGSKFQRSFYIRNGSLVYCDAVEEAVKGVISPVVYNLGIRSPEDHQSVTNQLVSAASSRYLDHRDRDLSKKLIPLNLEVLVEICIPLLRSERNNAFWFREPFRFSMEFKTGAIKGGVKAEGEAPCCCICLTESITVECPLVHMSTCTHLFHEDCITQWIEEQDHCPVCRTGVAWDRKWAPCEKPCKLL